MKQFDFFKIYLSHVFGSSNHIPQRSSRTGGNEARLFRSSSSVCVCCTFLALALTFLRLLPKFLPKFLSSPLKLYWWRYTVSRVLISSPASWCSWEYFPGCVFLFLFEIRCLVTLSTSTSDFSSSWKISSVPIHRQYTIALKRSLFVLRNDVNSGTLQGW